MADLLLGYAQQVTISNISISNLRAQNDFVYFQDDWKITLRLTLNLGMRYEVYFPITETDNRLANFRTLPGRPRLRQADLCRASMATPELLTTDLNNFAPRSVSRVEGSALGRL